MYTIKNNLNIIAILQIKFVVKEKLKMTYEEYEEMKIQEAVEIAEGIMAGKIKTISFEEFKKQIDELMENIIKEKNNNIVTKGEVNYYI